MPSNSEGVSKILRSKCRSSHAACNRMEIGHTLLFLYNSTHTIDTWSVLPSEYSKQNTSRSVSPLNFSSFQLKKVCQILELPRHTSHLDLQVSQFRDHANDERTIKIPEIWGFFWQKHNSFFLLAYKQSTTCTNKNIANRNLVYICYSKITQYCICCSENNFHTN